MEQYSSFAIPYRGTNYTIGRRDAGENIADNGGVKTAYRAFQRLPGAAKDQCIPGLPFSPNQLFWVRHGIKTRRVALLITDPPCGHSAILPTPLYYRGNDMS